MYINLLILSIFFLKTCLLSYIVRPFFRIYILSYKIFHLPQIKMVSGVYQLKPILRIKTNPRSTFYFYKIRAFEHLIYLLCMALGSWELSYNAIYIFPSILANCLCPRRSVNFLVNNECGSHYFRKKVL